MSNLRETLTPMSSRDIVVWRNLNEGYLKEAPLSGEYRIRGHHLRNFVSLLRNKSSLGTANEIIKDVVKFSNIGKDENPDYSNYYRDDVIGETSKERIIYETLLKCAFDQYLSLKDTSRIIINSEKDEICDCCKTGEHCNQSFDPGLEDSRYLASFYKALSWLGLTDKTDISGKFVETQYRGEDTTTIVLSMKAEKSVVDKGLEYLAKTGGKISPMSDSKMLPEIDSDYRQLVTSLGIKLD